eukprot:TRINITY_DN16197_c0_g1_i1.p1 TRINITY_DN16197_c0_g1~~TRINITY_DN16197_c0_g1_i1.p1  ORF type:complete len:233 (-),score=36.11 TRINITY_DN16197_c0_g1_i1:900-1598(-)
MSARIEHSEIRAHVDDETLGTSKKASAALLKSHRVKSSGLGTESKSKRMRTTMRRALGSRIAIMSNPGLRRTCTKSRAVSAYNAFYAERSVGNKFKVGTEQWRAHNTNTSHAWARLTLKEKQEYTDRAEQQQQQERKQLSSQSLAQTGNGAASVLTKSQTKRLGQDRLDASLTEANNHAVWQSGLGLMDYSCALKPSLVNLECGGAEGQQIMDHLKYDDQPVGNPRNMPTYF